MIGALRRTGRTAGVNDNTPGRRADHIPLLPSFLVRQLGVAVKSNVGCASPGRVRRSALARVNKPELRYSDGGGGRGPSIGADELKLDELVSRTYRLEDINAAFEALEQGEVARSVIAYG